MLIKYGRGEGREAILYDGIYSILTKVLRGTASRVKIALNGSSLIVIVPMSQASTPSGRVTEMSSLKKLLRWSAPGNLDSGPLR